LNHFTQREYLYKFIFPWAIERSKAWYPMTGEASAATRPKLEERAWGAPVR
jgi:hypothetical protein